MRKREGYRRENACCDRLDHLLEKHVGVPNLPRRAENLLEVEEMVLIERVERRGKHGLDAWEQRSRENRHNEKPVFVVVFLCARVQPIIIEQMRFHVLFFLFHQNNRLHIVDQFHKTRSILRSKNTSQSSLPADSTSRTRAESPAAAATARADRLYSDNTRSGS